MLGIFIAAFAEPHRPSADRRAAARKQVAGHGLGHLWHADGNHRRVDRERGGATLARIAWATVEEITWVTTGFVIANVVVMPLTAFLGHLFGQKRVYMAALLIFILSSALCGLARSLTTLVAFRFVQGLGAGPCSPPSRPSCARPFHLRNKEWPWRCSAWR